MGLITTFRWLRLGAALSPIFKQLEEQSKMKLSINSIIQLLGTAAQGIVAVGQFLPPKQQVWVHVGLSAIQGIVGVLAHFVNPDGTPAVVAYVKPEGK